MVSFIYIDKHTMGPMPAIEKRWACIGAALSGHEIWVEEIEPVQIFVWKWIRVGPAQRLQTHFFTRELIKRSL